MPRPEPKQAPLSVTVRQLLPARTDEWAIRYSNTVEEPGVISWEDCEASEVLMYALLDIKKDGDEWQDIMPVFGNDIGSYGDNITQDAESWVTNRKRGYQYVRHEEVPKLWLHVKCRCPRDYDRDREITTYTEVSHREECVEEQRQSRTNRTKHLKKVAGNA